MYILFQDDSIIAINKPSGLLTIRDGYNPNLPTVKTLLEEEFGRCLIVHRLDKETSGVLLVARNKDTHRLLNLAFENRQIHKIYHSIIIGVPPDNEFEINLPLKVDGNRNHRTVVNYEKGKPAKSSIVVLQTFGNFSLVEVKPETGYTHQIRAHLFNTGFPILGDHLYSKHDPVQFNFIERTALHAFQINFLHPQTNLPMTISATYPADFLQTLSLLKK